MKYLLTATLFICFLTQKVNCQTLDKAILIEFSRNMQIRMKTNEFALGGAYTVMKEALPKKTHYELMEALEGFGESSAIYNAFFYQLYKKVGGNAQSLRLNLQGLCDNAKLGERVAEYIESNFKTKLTNERKTPSKVEKLLVEKETEEEAEARSELAAGFPGGDFAFSKYLSSNLRLPEKTEKEGVDGVVEIEFSIMKDGKVDSVRVLRGLTPECDEEAKRVILASPRWYPAEVNGKPIVVKRTAGIRFFSPKGE